MGHHGHPPGHELSQLNHKWSTAIEEDPGYIDTEFAVQLSIWDVIDGSWLKRFVDAGLILSFRAFKPFAFGAVDFWLVYTL